MHTQIGFKSGFPLAWLPTECTLNYIAESVIELIDWREGGAAAAAASV